MAPEMAAREATRLAEADGTGQLVAVAMTRAQGVEHALGVAELVRDSSRPEVAEFAVVVADAYQREGIGSALCAYLVAAARRHGVTTLRVMALAENTAVRRIVARSEAPYTIETRQGMTTMQIDLGSRNQLGVFKA
jgi:GNAT superfamily N-acetyltransferase